MTKPQFNDSRSKKIVLVSHCLLNQNSISDGTADLPSAVEKITSLIQMKNVGIIQMPCPELMSLGLDRGDHAGVSREVVVENSRIRSELEKPENRTKLQSLVDGLVFQIKQYKTNGFDIKGVIGMNRSPSCGVTTTSRDDDEVAGEGVFIEMLKSQLSDQDLDINVVGIKTSEYSESIKQVQNLLQ